MSSNTHVQFEDVVHHEMSIGELAESMTKGQMQHMANHLWRHYAVGPQKLQTQLEDAMRENEILDGACDFWKNEKHPNGRQVTVDGVDYIMYRDGE
jgi:hypothetical protein